MECRVLQISLHLGDKHLYFRLSPTKHAGEDTGCVGFNQLRLLESLNFSNLFKRRVFRPRANGYLFRQNSLSIETPRRQAGLRRRRHHVRRLSPESGKGIEGLVGGKRKIMMNEPCEFLPGHPRIPHSSASLPTRARCPGACRIGPHPRRWWSSKTEHRWPARPCRRRRENGLAG